MASTTTHTEVGAEHGAKAPFPPFQTETFASQLLWLAITFGVFYFLMSKVALPRISSILETRSDRIAQDLEEANRLKDESDEAIAAYEQELAEAKSNAHGIAQQARDSAKADVEAKRAKVEADLASKVAEAETRIAGIKSKAMSEVGSIAEDTTNALVSQLLGGKFTKAEIASAVAGAKR
ncbi:MAG: F0F1 ATP synthase subunit B [Rhizobiaceae bacterium]